MQTLIAPRNRIHWDSHLVVDADKNRTVIEVPYSGHVEDRRLVARAIADGLKKREPFGASTVNRRVNVRRVQPETGIMLVEVIEN